MYKIALCDDEPAFLQETEQLIREIFTTQGIRYALDYFETAKDLLAVVNDSPTAFDLFLLDIVLDDNSPDNGVGVANRLRAAGNEAGIIFITSSPDFMLEGYSAEASGYLMKPITRASLEPTLLRAYKKYNRGIVLLDTPVLSASFHLKDIQYIEIFNRTLVIHTSAGTTELAMPLREIIEKLPHDQFIQCHRSYLVSIPSIFSIRRYEIELRNHEKIPVSKSFYKNVQNALLLWTAQI